MSNKDFEQFEKEVMQKIMQENPAIETVLRKQYENAKIINREFTGVGFLTTFEVGTKDLQLKEFLDGELGDVQAIFEGLEHGVGFILFIRNGFIETLEGYTYDEPWSGEIMSYTLVS